MLVLTERATEIIEMLIDGLSYKEIGNKLGLSERTCINHVVNAGKKNNLGATALIYAYAKSK